MSAEFRIIDANINRAREALRVMEEAARFALDDTDLTEQLKSLRHRLHAAANQFSITHRDTPNDVGTSITTESETRRRSMQDVVAAAGGRLSEALRVLEEYGKLINVEFAASMKQLRYECYDVQQRLAVRLPQRVALQWTVCVLLSESLCPPQCDWRQTAEVLFDAKVDCVQLREKEIGDDEVLRRATWLVENAPLSTAVIVNDRPDIAAASGAAGVHLGQTDLPVAAARQIVGQHAIIGVSTSNLTEAKRAHDDGADHCGVGPMFPTTTKEKDRIVGPDYLREYLEWDRLPHLAIGGISPSNIDKLVAVGCRGVAVSSSVCRAEDPSAVVETLRSALTHEVATPTSDASRPV